MLRAYTTKDNSNNVYWREAHKDRRSVIEETKFDVESSRKRWRRDENYNIIWSVFSVFSVFFEFSDVCDFKMFRTLSSIVDF